VVACAILVAVVVAARPKVDKSLPEAQARADEREDMEHPYTLVNGTHPRRDASLHISVRQLLSVEPFLETQIRSQVAGVVFRSPKSVGASVKQGELLIEIAAPDLEDAVAEKQALIRQRLKDVEVAQAQVHVAEAQVEVATELISQRRAEAGQAVETREYRKQIYDRFVAAAAAKGIHDSFVEEERRNYRAAIFAVLGADAAVRKAQADLKEKESILGGARADVKLKEALVEVARRAYDRAQTIADYARINAPYDGTITVRNKVADAGNLVQNASTAQTEPLLTLARTDIVTVIMKVPDNAAPFVSRDTEAILRFDELPGVRIRGRVARVSRSIQNTDRTMRVEVDLWNDTPTNYNRFKSKCLGTWLSSLSASSPLGFAPLMAAGVDTWSKEVKDPSDPFPTLPEASEKNDTPLTLLPGMSGYMRLNLRQFRGAFLLPSCAIFSQGGKAYIMEARRVESHTLSHMIPVRVQINDGRYARVSIIAQEADPSHGKTEVLRELTGNEVIILSRQVEIGEGQELEVHLEESSPAPEKGLSQ
jgi:multidrug resistance efflux pump